ncbi:MAG: hypothetical protein ABSC06_33085 [Rhodopila sp.]|jgi:hypothetical protein
MRRIASAVAMATLLAAGPASAFDAAGVEIIGLHLGMPDTEVVARLAHQGYALTRTQEAIAADTKDGSVQVALSADRGVTEIRYVFNNRGVGGPAKISEAVMIRFGNPDQASPPTWCLAVGRDGVCPGSQASLTFLPDALTLLLRVEADGPP